MKKNKFDFNCLKIIEFKHLENHVNKMIKISKKNKDFDVLNDMIKIKRGLEVAKDFIKYKINKYNKLIDNKSCADEKWRNAIIILKGMIRSEVKK